MQWAHETFGESQLRDVRRTRGLVERAAQMLEDPEGSLPRLTKGIEMMDYAEYLEGYRDAQAYDLEDRGYDADYPLTEQLARELGGPLLDLACGTGTMAIRLAEQGFQVTGVDIIPKMIAWASQKALARGGAIEWVVADVRVSPPQAVSLCLHAGQCLDAMPIVV